MKLNLPQVSYIGGVEGPQGNEETTHTKTEKYYHKHSDLFVPLKRIYLSKVTCFPQTPFSPSPSPIKVVYSPQILIILWLTNH